MSHRRHTWAAVVGSLAALTLLSGCFGSDSREPTAAQPNRHHSRSIQPTTPTEPTTTSTSGTSSPPTTAAGPISLLRYNPKSGGKHLDDCQRLQPGDDPAEFVYYPVEVRASGAVSIDSIATEHTQGVVDAASWVAPAVSATATGTFKGWPPKYVAQDSNLQWSKRVPAAGTTLEPAGWYNVFLRLQVDPTPGDSAVKGLVFTYHDGDGSHTDTWVASTTFSMSC
jgi:hypothetical protein